MKSRVEILEKLACHSLVHSGPVVQELGQPDLSETMQVMGLAGTVGHGLGPFQGLRGRLERFVGPSDVDFGAVEQFADFAQIAVHLPVDDIAPQRTEPGQMPVRTPTLPRERVAPAR